jgi:hypothetical protein
VVVHFVDGWMDGWTCFYVSKDWNNDEDIHQRGILSCQFSVRLSCSICRYCTVWVSRWTGGGGAVR